MLRAVLFDLGDTLVDFQPMDTRAVFREAARATYDALAKFPSSRPPPPFDVYCQRQYRTVRWSYFWAKLRRREFNSLHLLDRFCRKLGLTIEAKALLELAWLWYEPLTRRCSIEEDLPATLGMLRRSGLRLAVVSNTFVAPEIHDRHLAELGLLEHFAVRVYSSESGYRKPNPRIFQMALGRLGVAASEALFVGDLVKTDVVGARRMGMPTVLKQPWGTARRHRLADHVIARLSDLPEVIERLFQPPAPPVDRVEVARFPIASM